MIRRNFSRRSRQFGRMQSKITVTNGHHDERRQDPAARIPRSRHANAAALFAEDGALELPFLHSVGIPWRHRGRQAISEVQASLAGLYMDFAFKPEDTHVLIDTPEQVFAEYMAHP